ncbi:condensation domain-containing protein [Longispora sp. K20-0274]|uniref:condensation domain-containing protein n=1 Tax=Longispora sp. K20-0274 TaxID=3088255 RepID=UPI00399C0998
MTISEAPSAATGLLPLSLQQEFLRLFDQGDATGPFGPRYIIVDGWRLHGAVDTDALRRALADVVVRHESLRTAVIRGDGPGGQVVGPPSAPELVVVDLPGVPPGADRDRRAEELLNEYEAGTFEVHSSPLLRAVLGRFDDEDAVLALVTHHTAADAWSMQVIVRDLADCYAARAAGAEPELAPATQYREHAEAQRDGGDTPAVRAARDYWRETLRGARILVVPTDRAPSAEVPPRTSWYRFVTEDGLRLATTELADRTRSSAFMVLLAAFNVLVHERTGATDIVVPTFTPGRSAGRFQKTVGSFFNFVPLRTDLSGCGSFREVVTRTRAACIGAYSHELPLLQVLGEAPELMASAMAPGVAPCLFQVIQPPFVMDRERIGEVEYSAIWRRVLSQPVGSDIPDGMLWSLHLGPSSDIVGALGYSTHLFDRNTVDAFAADYRATLARLLADPDAPLVNN